MVDRVLSRILLQPEARIGRAGIVSTLLRPEVASSVQRPELDRVGAQRDAFTSHGKPVERNSRRQVDQERSAPPSFLGGAPVAASLLCLRIRLEVRFQFPLRAVRRFYQLEPRALPDSSDNTRRR